MSRRNQIGQSRAEKIPKFLAQKIFLKELLTGTQVPYRIYTCPGVANLASKYECLNYCSFRDMALFMVFRVFFFRKIQFEVSQNLKLPTL